MKEEDLQSDDVIFTGRLSDDQLLREIASAKFLVQPSLYEGFGLPPLEALYLGTQPIISDIPVFKEVYGDLPVLFFKTEDAKDLSDKLKNEENDSKSFKTNLLKYDYRKFADTVIKEIRID